MKLIRFSVAQQPIRFGVVISGHAIAFDTLLARAKSQVGNLRDSHSYLQALPESERQARELAQWGEQQLATFDLADKPLLQDVQLHAPVEVTALFDFGLTPRHLSNTLDTMSGFESGNPQTSALLQAMRAMLLAPRPQNAPGQPEKLPYYKCNLNSVVGSGTTVPWPVYTSYLDIEPELAVVYGNAQQPVAGYCIFNDVSARDVQVPEIIGGFCLSKDMAQGNQLGPYLVTADEVGNAFDLSVSVTVNGVERYKGSTSEISHHPEDMVAWLSLICPLSPGTVMGMGTIPDCTGMDHGDFLKPGDEIAIHIDRLGTLQTRFALPKRAPLPSRWPARDGLFPSS